MSDETLKTGTTTIGILCKDGVLFAADRRATAGNYIVDRRARKVLPVTDTSCLTIAGTVSDAQLLVKLLKAELRLKRIRNGGGESTIKEGANLLAGMVYANIRKMSMIPGIAHFLFGGTDEEGFHLYDVFPDGSLSEVTEYISSGSGSVIAYGVLETLYKPDLTIEEAKTVAIKAVNAALKHDSASGDGIEIVAVTKEGLKLLEKKEVTVDLNK